MSRYARSRNAHVARTLRSPNIDVAQHLKQVIRALRDNHSLLGVMDVPADEVKSSMRIDLLGMQACVPRGLLRLAVNQHVPVVIYITGLDTHTGQRFLRIRPLGIQTDVVVLARQVFGELEKIIVQNAPAWHFWGIAERFFLPDEPVSER